VRTLRPKTRAGFTLVEAAIAASLLVLLMSSAVMAARSGMGAFRTTQDASDAGVRARRALDRMVFELISADTGSLVPLFDNLDNDLGTDTLQFAKVTGLNGDDPTLGTPCRLDFVYAPGELDDGIDNDGNGLVDDGMVVLTRDVGGDEQQVVLCRGVSERLEGEAANGADDNGNGVIDEAGFNVHVENSVLVLRLSVEQPSENGTIVRTMSAAVRLRN
jgi:hypothetical protein